MARALLKREGDFSAPQGAWDGTTQQSKRNNRRQGKKKKKQQSKSVFSFPPEERAPFSARKDDGARATLWRGRLLSASARVGWVFVIARERMHPDDHHLITRQQALLPTFENEEDADSKIDVGVDEDKEL